MKAMILAAGRGKRMGPLTEHTPKPLLEVAGNPLIAYHLQALANIGIRDIIINVSHHAEKIQQALGDGSHYGVRIHYSIEPEALETGGGIYQALPLLGPDPFLVVSADIWTKYNFAQLPRTPRGLAHMVLVPNPDFHPTGDFYLEDGLIRLQGTQRYTFGNIGIYKPELFQNCKPGIFPLIDHYFIETIKNNMVTGELFIGEWDNLGTPEQLMALNQSIRLINS